jgi:hypothetical protein
MNGVEIDNVVQEFRQIVEEFGEALLACDHFGQFNQRRETFRAEEGALRHRVHHGEARITPSFWHS